MKGSVPDMLKKIPGCPSHTVVLTEAQRRRAIERECGYSARLVRRAGYDIVDGKLTKITTKKEDAMKKEVVRAKHCPVCGAVYGGGQRCCNKTDCGAALVNGSRPSGFVPAAPRPLYSEP